MRYVLNGSVRRSGSRLRIGAQLSEASTRLQVWTQRFDVGLTDFFSVQDEIARNVTAAIEPELFAAEHQRFESRQPESLDAWGFVMKAMPHVWSWRSPREIEAVEALLRRALEVSPDYPRAHSLLAWARATAVHQRWAGMREGLAEAGALAQRGIQLNSRDPWSHFVAGYVHMMSREFGRALEDYARAIELNPSFAFAHLMLGVSCGYSGMPEDGLRHLATAARLSPRDFAESANHSSCGLCHFIAGRYDEAADCERRAVDLNPDFVTAWRTYAAAAGMAGRLEEADSRALAGQTTSALALRRMGGQIPPDRPRERPCDLYPGPPRRRARIARSMRRLRPFLRPLSRKEKGSAPGRSQNVPLAGGKSCKPRLSG